MAVRHQSQKDPSNPRRRSLMFYSGSPKPWQIATVTLALLVFLLILLDVFDLSIIPGKPDPNMSGDVATWFSGIVTALAVSIALFESIAQKDRRREDELQMRTAVYARLEIDAKKQCWQIELINSSGASVQSWVLSSDSCSLHLCSSCWGPISTRGMYDALDGAWIGVLPKAEAALFFPVSICFIDTMDVGWIRRPNGRLENYSVQEIRNMIHSCQENSDINHGEDTS